MTNIIMYKFKTFTLSNRGLFIFLCLLINLPLWSNNPPKIDVKKTLSKIEIQLLRYDFNCFNATKSLLSEADKVLIKTALNEKKYATYQSVKAINELRNNKQQVENETDIKNLIENAIKVLEKSQSSCVKNEDKFHLLKQLLEKEITFIEKEESHSSTIFVTEPFEKSVMEISYITSEYYFKHLSNQQCKKCKEKKTEELINCITATCPELRIGEINKYLEEEAEKNNGNFNKIIDAVMEKLEESTDENIKNDKNLKELRTQLEKVKPSKGYLKIIGLIIWGLLTISLGYVALYFRKKLKNVKNQLSKAQKTTSSKNPLDSEKAIEIIKEAPDFSTSYIISQFSIQLKDVIKSYTNREQLLKDLEKPLSQRGFKLPERKIKIGEKEEEKVFLPATLPSSIITTVKYAEPPSSGIFKENGLKNKRPSGHYYLYQLKISDNQGTFTLVNNRQTHQFALDLASDFLYPACTYIRGVPRSNSTIQVIKEGKIKKVAGGWRIDKKLEISFS